MSKRLIQQLKGLKHGEANPRAEWVKNNRDFLLSQIKNTLPVEQQFARTSWQSVWPTLSIFLPQNFVYNVLRPAVILLVVISVASSGWITTVDAAYDSLPGDLLYPAKRAAEKTQATVVAVLGDKNAETKLHVKFAKRRATETKKIVAIAATNPKKKSNAIQAVAELKKEIQNVGDSLTEMKIASAEQQGAAEAAKDVGQNTEQIKMVLKEVKDDLLVSSSTEDRALSQEVAEVKDLVKDVGMQAMEVMVTKHMEGDQSVSSDEVKQSINKTLQAVATDATESKQNAQSAQIVVEAVKTEATAQSKILPLPAVTTESKALEEKVSNVSAETKEAAIQTTAASLEVDKKVIEAQKLLVSGDLAGAMDIAKEASTAASQSEKISDSALQQVQSVVPIVVVKESVGILPLPPATSTLDILTTTTIKTSTGTTTVILSPVRTVVSSSVQLVAPITAIIIIPTTTGTLKK